MPRDSEKKRTHITKDLECCHGADNSRRLYSYTRVTNGETDAVVELTITKRLPITKLAEAELLYDRLGEYGHSLDELLPRDKEGINIVFSHSEEPDGLLFVEVEDDNGVSVGVGEWIDRGEYRVLRITT